MYKTEFHETISCVGKKSEYASLLSAIVDPKYRFTYYGERLSDNHPFGKCVMLLNTEIINISYCIKNSVNRVLFFHRGYILSPKDVVLISELEQRYIRESAYLALKELNVIKLLFDVLKKNVALTSFPMHIQMEHTTFCNAKCIMCDHYIAHNRGSRHLTLNTVRTIEPLLPYATLIVLHGNGEPLINPNLPEILSLYKKYQVSLSLNTNLSYLPDDILWLLKSQCRSIHVSCDGSNEQQYESIRLGLSYSEFIKNVKRLQSVCSNTEKVLEVVLMRQNIKDAVNFVKFAYDNGFLEIIFNALGCNKWIKNEHDGLHNFLPAAQYFCSAAKSEGIRLGIKVETPFDSASNSIYNNISLPNICCTTREQGLENSKKLHKQYEWYTNTIAVEQLDLRCIWDHVEACSTHGICEYPFAKTYIDLNGNVSFCCPASRKIIDSISNERSFPDIWNSKAYQSMRESFYQKRLPHLCRDCYFIQRRDLRFLDIEEGGNTEYK